MKTITTTAIVALMTATIGLGAIAPTYAQQATPTPAPSQEQVQGKAPGANFRHNNQDQRRGGGFGDLLGFERGPEAVEIALVRLSHAIELTPEQQPLFDTLKIESLAAAGSFATAVESLRPKAAAEGQTAESPTFSQRLENRITIETAHLAALKQVQPAVTAFFDSLTDAQKASLSPQRPDRDGARQGMPGKGGDRHHDQQHKGPGPMGGPATAPAPEAPATNG